MRFIRVARFRVEKGQSLADPDLDVIRIVYDDPGNPFFIRPLVDEIRQIGPDEYLGQGMYQVLGKAFWPLVPGEEVAAAAGEFGTSGRSTDHGLVARARPPRPLLAHLAIERLDLLRDRGPGEVVLHARRPFFPKALAISRSRSSRLMASAQGSGRAGTTRSPVSPSTTVSRMPPTALATIGVSQAIDSRLMIPKGS